MTALSSSATDDPTFLQHLGGKIEVALKRPLTNREELAIAYTPGVARVSERIVANPASVWDLTVKRNAVAVVTDGTAVLGLGDIGPEAALPVMEGKAMLFKQFGGIDAWPICLGTTAIDRIVATVEAMVPALGGVNLEDISSPRCFEIERRLDEALDIPVFHDDQHGTAIVVLAALRNALAVVGKRLDDVKIVITGAGAAGVATTKMLLVAGAKSVVVADRRGILYRGREDLSGPKAACAEVTNADGERGSADEALQGADVYIGLSTPGAVTVEGVRAMARDAVVFALANPVPEVVPEALERLATVVATGRSDYPNQINNVLAFPGVFRGALDVRASAISAEMKLAAADALAATVTKDELRLDYVVPSVFNPNVVPAVACSVARAAVESGVARAIGDRVPVPATKDLTGAGPDRRIVSVCR
jgi:malate dehydrogenase (oxaloacetate-decarboxylating)